MRRLRTNPVNLQSPLNRGLVSWWLNLPYRRGGGGLIFRDWVSGYHGDFVGIDTTNWSSNVGRVGGFGSIQFDNVATDAVAMPSNTNAPGLDITGDQITVSCWVRATKGTRQGIVSKLDNAGTMGYAILTESSGIGRYRWLVSAGSLIQVVSNSVKGDDGIWHQVTGTYDGANARLYFDGLEDSASPGAGTGNIKSYSNGLDFGSLNDTTNFGMGGQIDDVRIYNRALSANEVMALYQDSKAGYPRTLSWDNNVVYLPTAAGGVVLVAQDISQSQGIDSVGLTQANVLAPADLGQVQSVDNVVLVQANVIAANDLSQLQAIDSPTILQAYVISPDDITQLQSIDNVVLSTAVQLNANDLTQAQEIDAPAIVQAYVLTAADMVQAQGVDAPTLLQGYVLSVDDVAQLQGIDGVTLTQKNVLAVDSVTQLQGIDSPAITQTYVINVDDLTQLQTITFGFDLTPGAMILLTNATDVIKLANGTVINLITNNTIKYKVH